MKLHQLKPPPGSRHARKRLGRGDASGHGGTSTRGHKGHKSRTGFSLSFNFEGGQMPLARRVPKHGFSHAKSVRWVAINLKQILSAFSGVSEISLTDFRKRSWLGEKDYLKVLGNGQVTAPVQIQAHAFSSSARAKIEKAGGKAVVINAITKP